MERKLASSAFLLDGRTACSAAVLPWLAGVRKDGIVIGLHPLAVGGGVVQLLQNDWWVALIFCAVCGGSVREGLRAHHRRRLAIIAAKAELAERKNAANLPRPEPQPICGCSHHLSFHNPSTSACAVDECRCQQYVGPEPLGHVIALPVVDPERLADKHPSASPEVIGKGMLDSQQA